VIRLKRPLAAQALLFVSLLGAFGLFDYYQITSLKTLSELSLVALFTWLALSTKLDSRWVVRVFLPAFGLLIFVLTYAYVFILRVDAPILPSILSRREYIYFLLGPVVYLLYLRGWRLADFQRIFLVAVMLTVASLAVYDVALSTRSLLLSGSFFVLNLEAAADQAGIYRTLNTDALFLALYFGRRLFQTRDVFFLIFALGTVVFSGAIVAISLPRGLLSSIGGALILYAAFLSRPGKVKLSVITLPLSILAVMLLLPILSNAFVGQFGQDQTYVARTNTANTAWQSFHDYPLFGFGSDSVYSVTFQDLFGRFYPSDIGLLGVIFQFGLVGLVLYLLLVGWLCASLLRLMWAYAEKASAAQSTFLRTLFVVCLSLVVASPLQAKFIYGIGLPLGAFAWGLIMAHGHGMLTAPGRYAANRDAAAVYRTGTGSD